MYPLTNKIERTRAELLSLGEMLSAYGGQRIALDELARGGNVDSFMRRVAENVRAKAPMQAVDDLLGIRATDPEAQPYSIMRAIRAHYERKPDEAGLEADISNLVTTRTGQAALGFWVPLNILGRDFNLGTPGQAGNMVGSPVHGAVVDPLRKLSITGSLGATMLTALKGSGNLDVVRFESSSDPAFKGEIDGAAVMTATTQSATIHCKRIACVFKMSRQAIVQSTPQLDAVISRQLYQAALSVLDDNALNGSGTGEFPLGIRNTVGIHEVKGGPNGAQIDFSHLADLEDAPADANVAELAPGFAVNAPTRRYLRTKERGTGLDYVWDDRAPGGPLLGHKTAVSNLLPSNLTKGSSSEVCSSVLYSADWSKLYLGFWNGAADILVDRVTLADQGDVRVIVNLFCGAACTLPAAFAKMDDALTA